MESLAGGGLVAVGIAAALHERKKKKDVGCA